MDWDDCRVLLEVHRSGSFSAAGTRLGLSASTAMRRIESLEQRLGRTLVRRSSRGVRIEPAAEGLLRVAAQFEQALAAQERVRDGTVRVSVPEGFGAFAAQAVHRCLRRDPDLIVEVAVEARFVDLAGREADIALRGGRSASRVLMEKRVGEVDVALFGSPGYLREHLPKRVVEKEHYPRLDFVVGKYALEGGGPDRWLMARGATRFRFRSTSAEARLEAARLGLGLVMYAAHASLPGLEVVALDAPPPSTPFYVTMHRELRQEPRIRAVSQALVEAFTEQARGGAAR